jgi:hypothetical protein
MRYFDIVSITFARVEAGVANEYKKLREVWQNRSARLPGDLTIVANSTSPRPTPITRARHGVEPARYTGGIHG